MSDLKKAYELTASLLSHQSYQTLTQALINYFNTLNNINDVVAYEIFGDTAQNDILIRRFPVSLSEDYKDENNDLLLRYLSKHNGGVNKVNDNGQDYIFLDIHTEVPRRLILIKGQAEPKDMDSINGLYQIYANQVSLLDSKERDVLTGLPNRQTLETTLNDILSFYQKNPVSNNDLCSWLTVIDIDNFKNINDTFGHLYGDEVLIHFSTLMKKTFRYSDFLFRYGGEEFIVILNNADNTITNHTLEKFRKTVEEFNFPSGQVTISLGYTKIEPALPSTAIIEKADKAMYFAKSHGKNQVVNSTDIKDNNIPTTGEIDLF